MNEKTQQTSSTASTAKPKRTGTRRNRKRNSGGGDHSFLKAKKSNIPQPIEGIDKTQDVATWGANNLYPYYLNYLKKNNPIHGGIIGSKVHYTVSGGLVYEGQDVEAYNRFYENGKVDFDQNNMDELMEVISDNLETANMFCFLVKFNQVGMPKAYRKTERIPFEKIRFEFVELDDKQVQLTGVIKVSEDWSNNKIEPELIKPYSGKDNQAQFYVLYQGESGQTLDEAQSKMINPGFYPSPTYAGAIVDIDTGIAIGKYNNAEIHNGFSLGTIISMHNGRIQDEQKKKKFEGGLRAAATGEDQTGGIFIVYGNGKEETTKVDALNGNNLPDRYKNTKEGSADSTLHAHNVTVPILFGVKTEGSLGNATELKVGYEIMRKNYFNGQQKKILRPLNWIAQKFAGLQGVIAFAEVELDLPEDEPEQPMFTINNSPTKTEQSKFDKDDELKIIERFKSLGRDKSDLNLSKSYALKDYDNVSETDCIDVFKAEFASLSDQQAQVLGLRQEGNGFNDIRKAMDIGADDLAKIYRSLISNEFLTSDGTITELGATELVASDIDRLEILYEYRERPDAPELQPGGTSRDFCRTLLSLNRLYTRQEIDIISGVEGYNVFAYRGGWYHDPNNDQNQPGCRHEWRQVVTFV